MVDHEQLAKTLYAGLSLIYHTFVAYLQLRTQIEQLDTMCNYKIGQCLKTNFFPFHCQPVVHGLHVLYMAT